MLFGLEKSYISARSKSTSKNWAEVEMHHGGQGEGEGGVKMEVITRTRFGRVMAGLALLLRLIGKARW